MKATPPHCFAGYRAEGEHFFIHIPIEFGEPGLPHMPKHNVTSHWRLHKSLVKQVLSEKRTHTGMELLLPPRSKNLHLEGRSLHGR